MKYSNFEHFIQYFLRHFFFKVSTELMFLKKILNCLKQFKNDFVKKRD